MKKVILAAIAAMFFMISCGDTKQEFGQTGYKKVSERNNALSGVESPDGILIIEKNNKDIKCYPDQEAGVYFIAKNVADKYDFYDKIGDPPKVAHVDTFKFVTHPDYPYYEITKRDEKGFYFVRENVYIVKNAPTFELDQYGNFYLIDADDGVSYDMILSRTGKELLKIVGGQIGYKDGKYVTITAKPKKSLYDKKGKIFWKNAVYTYYDTSGNPLDEKVIDGKKIFE